MPKAKTKDIASVEFTPVKVAQADMPANLDYQLPTRTAFLILKKNKPELIAMLNRMDTSTLETTLDILHTGSKRFKAAAEICETAMARLYIAAEADRP